MRIRTGAMAATVAVAGASLWLTSMTGVVASETPATEDPCLTGTVDAEDADEVVDSELDCAIESLEVDFGDGVVLPVQPANGGVSYSLAASEDLPVTEYQVYTSADGELATAAGDDVHGTDDAVEELEDELGVHAHDEDHESARRDAEHRRSGDDEVEEASTDTASDAVVSALFRPGTGVVLQAATVTTMCASGDQADTGTTWSDPLRWRYSSAGQPSTAALTRINAAAGRIPAGTNHCSLTRKFKLSETYLGTTSTRPGVTDTTCSPSNGANIVGWGTFTNASVLGATCRYTIGSRIVEADIAFNSSRTWYTGSSTTGCTGSRYDLQGVAFHEWGHAVGLAHVPQASGLVMRPTFEYCVTNDRKMGRGDYRSMRDTYGYAS